MKINLEELLESYLKNNPTAMKSVLNFQVWLRKKGFKRTDYLKDKKWQSIKGELNMIYEDWLIVMAASGERHSQTYTQLLKAHQDKMKETKQNEEPINITLDFKNSGKNVI